MVVFRAKLLLAMGILLLLSASSVTTAQVNPKQEIGLRIYSGFYAQRLPEGDRYRPFVIAPYYSFYLSKREAHGKVSIYLEPQITLVHLDYTGNVTTSQLHSHEYGFNAGLNYSYWWKRITLYLGLGSGPNYITVHTERQARGFIFSDNLYVGIKERIFKSYYLDLHGRGRHISNAGLKNPNSGINNFFVGVGISKVF